MKIKSFTLAALAACTIIVGANAATVLYSENFNGEGTAVGVYDDGTTPEINFGSIGILQSTGASQGGNAGDAAWSLSNSGIGQNGLRFGNGYNWATGLNAATILLAGGFSVAFDYTVAGDAENWMAVRVGSGGENSFVNAADVTFGALARGDGRMQTFENAAADSFGTATVGATRSARFNYEFTSWAAGATVTFTGIIDGNTVATDIFTWDATDDMKIVFAGYADGTLVDNIVVSAIPEPSSALLGGLGLLALLRRRR